MGTPSFNNEHGGFLMTPPGLRLFNYLHGVDNALHPRLAVLVCAPLSGERSFSQRALVGLGRHLAARGYPTMRFDWIGSGDSEGDPGCQSVVSHCQDTAMAIGQLLASTGAERVVLLGLRYGALLASLVACGDHRVAGIVLVDPVVSGPDYWADMLRGHQMNCVMRGQPAPKLDQLRQVPESGVIEAKGEAYAVQWVREIQDVDLRKVAEAMQVPRLLIRYDLTPRNTATLDEYAQAMQARGIALTQWQDEGAPFWTERSLYDGYQPQALYGRITEWLAERSI